MEGLLYVTIEGRNIIAGNMIIGKTPPIDSDDYDYVIIDNFNEIEEGNKYTIDQSPYFNKN